LPKNDTLKATGIRSAFVLAFFGIEQSLRRQINSFHVVLVVYFWRERGGDIMANKKYLIIAVLATFCLTAALFMTVPTKSQTGYDSWIDVNDDGTIDMADISMEIEAFMATGTPIDKTTLLLELLSRLDSLNASVIELQSRTGSSTPNGSIFRWNVFDTYDNAWVQWLFNDESWPYGGVRPQQWTDAGATAGMISADKETQRTLFTRKGYGGVNATVYSEVFLQYSSTTGRVVVAFFRIKNTMDITIEWRPYFKYTADSTWGEKASLALNGVDMWTGNGGLGTQSGNVSLPIPPNRTSTVIFVSTSSQASIPISFICIREVVLAFCNNSLALPTGLKYVDDLDTATGGWDQ